MTPGELPPSSVIQNLHELPILCVDVQSTGANPTRGRVLELSFWQGTARSTSDVRPTTHLVRGEPGETLARSVRRVTGITDGERDSGIALDELARRWLRIIDAPPRDRILVAHYARFERAFLEDLVQRTGAEPRAQTYVCLHAIGRKLHPELPRCSLHALAGYHGKVLPTERRAGPHVEATAFLWRAFVERLVGDHGITTLDELTAWLAVRSARPRSPRVFPLSVAKRRALPRSPGVYHFRAADGTLLYVGKATSLRARVAQHFHASQRREKSLEFLSQITEVTHELTETALEAALLECERIHAWQPPYNDALMPRDRFLRYADPLFTSFDRTASHTHRVGPFPNATPLELIAALRRHAFARTLPTALSELGFPTVMAMENGALENACRTLLDEALPCANDPTRALLRFGWHVDRSFRADAITEEDEEPRERDRPLDSAAVLDWLRRALAHVERDRRRALALCLLAQSTVRWGETTATGNTRVRELALAAGDVVARRDATEDDATPLQGRRSPRRTRTEMSLPRYDFLRVLRTELAVRADEGSDVRILLPGGRSMPSSLMEGVVRRRPSPARPAPP